MSRTMIILMGLATLLAGGGGVAASGAALAQGAAVPRPGPVETAPLQAPGTPPAPLPAEAPAQKPSVSQEPGLPREPARASPQNPAGGGGVTLTQEPAPGAPGAVTASPPGPVTGRPTLLPTPGDPLDVAEVTLPGKPAAVLSGQTTWDEGFESLKNAFAKIEGELSKAGLRPAGRPVTVFLETDDMGFRYEAMVPIERAPEGRGTLTPEIRFGRTPEGRAYHFLHKGPYDDIDSTYETITAYLDAKGILAKDVFIEEYVTDFTDSTDGNLEINIFVQPR